MWKAGTQTSARYSWTPLLFTSERRTFVASTSAAMGEGSKSLMLNVRLNEMGMGGKVIASPSNCTFFGSELLMRDEVIGPIVTKMIRKSDPRMIRVRSRH